MKTGIAVLGLIASLAIATMALGQTYFEYIKSIQDSPITWLKGMDYSTAVQNDDISINDLSFDNASNCIRFKFFNYNLLKWQPVTQENGELVFVPETPNVRVCLFIYSKRKDCWIGGPVTSISLGVEFADINGIYNPSNGWPKLTGRIKSTTPLAMCLLKNDGTERSPIIFNY